MSTELFYGILMCRYFFGKRLFCVNMLQNSHSFFRIPLKETEKNIQML